MHQRVTISRSWTADASSMPIDGVDRGSFAVSQQRQRVVTPTPVSLSAARNIIQRRVQRDTSESHITRLSRPPQSPQSTAAHSNFEPDRKPLHLASVELADGSASDAPSNGESGYEGLSDVVDNCHSSPDFTEMRAMRAESGIEQGSGDCVTQPDWLVVRRHLDNQILRRQLRCQRVDALVTDQFDTVLSK